MKVVKSVFLLTAMVLLMTLTVSARSACSWYCVRKKDHTQPTLSKELSFVEEYDVFWCDKNHSNINDSDKVVYLTFDAGYENGNIQKIVNVLKEQGVKATFFILDNMILKNEALVREMIDDGHIVANHTMKHKDMTKMTCKEAFEKELTDLEDLFKSTYGTEMPKYYRPPEGKLNEENLKWARDLGYKTVMWSFAYADWDNDKQPSHESAMKKILENVHNGEVMLLHPTSSTNAEIIGELIDGLKKQGFRFDTVDGLCT